MYLCNVVLCAFDCCGVVQQQQLQTDSHESISISLISFLSQTLPPFASAINTFLVYQGGEAGGGGSRHLVEPQPPRAPPPTLHYPHPPPSSFEGFHHQQFPQHTTDFQQLYGSQFVTQGFPTSTNQSQPAVKNHSSIATTTDDTEYANKMGDTKHQASSSSRLALRNAGVGEIVEVQGGHIVRSIGRKDRHSKVFTAKGPRDRRVRLSAHTAIQFYDVQDRLGYDRPSKAVDWLLKKAKPAIDELPKLPPWKPTATIIKSPKEEDGGAQPTGSSDEVEMDDGDGKGFYIDRQDHHQQQQEQHHQQNCNNADSCGLLPPSLDSDAIADTIKSFFPMGCTTHGEVSAATSSSQPQPMQFSSYMPELMSREERSHSHSQDLRLSLQSFRETMMMQSRPHHHHQAAHHSVEQQPFFPGAASHLGFNYPSSGWIENHPADMGRFQRLVGGSSAGSDGNCNAGGGGFMFQSSPSSVTPMQQPTFFGQLLSQGGTLQSSYNPLIRAWINDPLISNSVMEPTRSTDPYPVAGTGSAYTDGFSGFHIPARIRGEEEHDGDPKKPSSTSSSSRH